MEQQRRDELEAQGFSVGIENPIDELASECVECGHTERGKVTLWLTEDDEGNAIPRDDVRCLCSGCREVTDRNVRVTERGNEPWVWKEP